MRSIFIVVLITLITACTGKKAQTTDQNVHQADTNNEVQVLKDSIYSLLQKAAVDRDSMHIFKALDLTDQAMRIDTSKSGQYYLLYTKVQLLTLMNRMKEAFLLRDNLVNKDPGSLDRLVYKGLRFKLEGVSDSSKFYFNKAMDQCNKILKDTLNFDVLLKKIEIYMYEGKKADAKKTLEEGLRKSHDNAALQDIVETFDDDYAQTREALKSLEESFRKNEEKNK